MRKRPLSRFLVLGSLLVVGLLVVILGMVRGRTPSVTDRIDALREAGTFPAFSTLPSAARKAALNPDAGLPTPAPASRFERCPDGLAVIAMGSAAVPALRDLLVDRKRRIYAAALLGEIGGDPAAQALLAQWRGLRGRGREVDVTTLHSPGVLTAHQRYEPEDGGYHREYIHALCLCGLPVAAEVARETAVAMDLAEKLHAEGVETRRSEHRESPDGPLDVEWDIEPVDTACEGLHILGMTGAPEAVELFERALRSPVSSIARAACDDVIFLGGGQERTLPALGALMESPRLRMHAIKGVAWLTDREFTPRSPTPTEEAALAARYKQRLQDLGHLPR